MTEARRRGDQPTVPSSSNPPGSLLLLRETGALAAPGRLRELAGWYREFAERTGNPTIWEARLRTAEDLDAEADRLEQRLQD
jgi:hypothetical protein